MNSQAEIAEASAIPFSRENLAAIVGVSKSQLNNWLTRNQLWQTHRGAKFHRHYSIRELFDLAGFAAMREAGVPERQCAQFVRNFGFYRKFLSDHGRVEFSRKNGKWQMGIFDPDAVVTLSINMRQIGIMVMNRLADCLVNRPDSLPRESLEAFAALYRVYVDRGFLPGHCVDLFATPR